MSILVFCGPSLPPGPERERFSEITFLEPAQCGDLYLACKHRPRAIGLIDGYFDHRLSVWHKEILWALSQGIPVFGAASMGALRAAELADHRMVGVGVIFRQYHSGEIEDDDEVAVLHESADHGYAVSSDAMVNIRATLKAAFASGLIDSAGEAALIAAAKASFYADRRFSTILEATTNLSPAERQALERWISVHGMIDQKRLDALALLERMSAREPAENGASSGREDPGVARFERTNFWHVLQQHLDRQATPMQLAEPSRRRTLPAFSCDLGERDLELPASLRIAVLERALALLLAERAGAEASVTEVQAESERLRRSHGLLSSESTEEWLRWNSLDLSGFSALSRDEVLTARFIDEARALAQAQLPNALRLLGIEPATRR